MMNGGRIEFYANWYKTDRMGQLRERIFVTAPWTDSTFRFGRSLFSNGATRPGRAVRWRRRPVAHSSASRRMIDWGCTGLAPGRRIAVEVPDVERLVGR